MREWSAERIAAAAGARVVAPGRGGEGPARAVIDSRQAGPGLVDRADVAGHDADDMPSHQVSRNGRQIRCFCHVLDVVPALVRLVEDDSAHGKAFNLGSSDPVTIGELERIILDIIPCHLLTEFWFRYLTWRECEAQGFTWRTAESAGHTWESFEKAVGDA